MKKIIYIVAITVLSLFFVSCDEESSANEVNNLLDTWVHSSTTSEADINIVMVLSEGTFSTETVVYYINYDLNITCQSSGIFNVIDTEINWSEIITSCDNLDEDIGVEDYTGAYVLYEDTLTLTESNGESRVYNRQ